MSENDRSGRHWEAVAASLAPQHQILWCHDCWRIVRAKKRGFGLKCSAPKRRGRQQLTCLARLANTAAKPPKTIAGRVGRAAAGSPGHTPPNEV